MEQNILSLEAREGTGKGVARKIRAAGRLPGVFYGPGKSQAVTMEPRMVEKTLLQEGGKNTVFTLKGAGVDNISALIKDYQVDPVSRKLLHVDLMEIDVKQKVLVTVALHFTGKCEGVAMQGGVLNIVEREIKVNCLPTAIPSHIDVDVTKLLIGESVHEEDLQLPSGVERAVSHSNNTLVTIVPPTKEEEAAPDLGEAEAPEVLSDKKDEGEGEAGDKGGEKSEEAKKGADKKDEKK